ncbi:MAG: class I SAM-dependent methyltransferase [Acidimicrobiales bacterium]
MGVHEVAASGFGAGADDYERGRPSYPEDVVTWLVDRLRIGPGRRVVDLAAGTGKLTRLLVPSGAEVIAVEPVAAMRDKLADAAPGVVALDGTAEALPFDDATVDAVTVAQAFHWFDADAALAEIARVLGPGGALGLVWNDRDTREPWVAELSRLIRWDERERWRVPYTVEVDWGRRVAEADAPFGPGEHLESGYRQPMEPETLVARVLSTSYLAGLASEVREEIAGRVRSLVAPLGDRFELPYRTYAWAFRRS